MNDQLELPEYSDEQKAWFKKRFRGYYPVVVDVETGGFNAETDALLEIAAVTLQIDENFQLSRLHTVRFHVEPFEGANGLAVGLPELD